jgi:hypothetical protein
MGKRWYRQPHWWFDTSLELPPPGPFGHMFLCLPAHPPNHLLIASLPSWQIDANLILSPITSNSASMDVNVGVGESKSSNR